MATFDISNRPFLQSAAQLIIFPVSSNGTIVDPTLNRCKTLFYDNYQQYQQACLDGRLTVGGTLLVRHRREQIGLGVSAGKRAGQPDYIANIAITDHATHPMRKQWLSNALTTLYPELFQLIRYAGLRRIALLGRPLLQAQWDTNKATERPTGGLPANLNVPIMDWHTDTLVLIQTKLAPLPKVRIDIHLPHSFLVDRV